MSEPLLTPKTPPPLPGKSSLGIASMALGLIGLVFATASIYFLFGATMDRAFAVLIFSISFVVVLAAVVMGLIAMFGRPSTGRGLAISGTLCGGLGLIALVLAGIAVPMRTLITKVRAIPPVIVERPPIVVAPIELSDTAKKKSDVLEAWRVWLLRKAIDPKKSEIAGQWNEEVTGKILDAFLADWTGAPDRPTQEDWNRLYAELTDVRRYGEPFSRLLLAEKAQLPRDLASLVTPIGSLREKETNPFWLLLLELQSSEAYTGTHNTGRMRSSDKGALDAFERLIEEEYFVGEEWWLLADLTNFAYFPAFFDRQSEYVIEILETHDVPDWFLHYMRGRRFRRLAWDARGSGFADSVTEEGWKGFREHLAQARTELERSYELAPEYPFAAAKMISVAMADSDDPLTDMRLWFDRAIEAQSDYWPAYDNWLWGMHPRWHGTHEAMLEFGEHCLATKRFDTRVPNYYLASVRKVASDSDNGIYSDEDVYGKLRQLCLDEANHAEDYRTIQEWRTLLAVLAFRNEKYGELQEQWNELHGDLDQAVLSAWSVTQEIFDSRAALGAGTETVKKAVAAERKDKPGEAAKLYEKAAGEAGLSDTEQKAIRRRQAIVELESRYESGEWIELIPGPPDLWNEIEGSFEVGPDGSFLATSDTVRFAIEHPMVIGQHCEIEWEVDTPDDRISAIGPGVMVSSSRFDSTKWNAFYVSQVDGERSYKVSRFRYRSDMFEAAEKEDRVKMRLVCHRRKWLAYVDDEKIHRGDIELNVSFFGSASRLALGAFTTNPTKDCVIRYHRLRVRKLPEEEKTDE